jgi:hypothetical protein
MRHGRKGYSRPTGKNTTMKRTKKRPTQFRIVSVKSSARHEAFCSICAHPDREAIERDFIEWESPTRIARQYRLGSRTAVYRHARALDLFRKRDAKIKMALAKFIEKAGSVRVTAPAIVQAIAVFAKLNARGQWIDRAEIVDVGALFDRMTDVELAEYARDGRLPGWFEQTVGAAGATLIQEIEKPEAEE